MKPILYFTLFLALLSYRSLHAQTNETMLHDGLTREYILYVPTTYQVGQSVPLVFVLHGFTQSAQTIMDVTEFNAVSESNNFIVAYPNGVGNAWNTHSGFPGGSSADDIGFIDALADSLSAEFGIDTTRVYSCGFSAGGFLSHRLACESPRCFAAIASVSGTMSNNASDDCAPQHSTPVMQIHGTSDIIVSYNGSIFSGIGVSDVITQWSGLLNCPTTPVITALPDIDTGDGSTVEKQVYTPCDGSSEVVLLKVNGGGHQWPGSSAVLGGIGNTNQDIDASQEIWSFFQNFSCGQLATSLTAPSALSLQAWPNPCAGLLQIQGLNISTSYELLDATGRSVRSGSFTARTAAIDMGALDTGSYVIRLLDGSGRFFRVVKD